MYSLLNRQLLFMGLSLHTTCPPAVFQLCHPQHPSTVTRCCNLISVSFRNAWTFKPLCFIISTFISREASPANSNLTMLLPLVCIMRVRADIFSDLAMLLGICGITSNKTSGDINMLMLFVHLLSTLKLRSLDPKIQTQA